MIVGESICILGLATGLYSMLWLMAIDSCFAVAIMAMYSSISAHMCPNYLWNCYHRHYYHADLVWRPWRARLPLSSELLLYTWPYYHDIISIYDRFRIVTQIVIRLVIDCHQLLSPSMFIGFLLINDPFGGAPLWKIPDLLLRPSCQVPLSAWLSALAAFLGTTLVALDDQVATPGVALQSLNK